MEIIEQIKTDQLIEKPTEIQEICLNKLKSNPLKHKVT
jgi:Fe-S cluster assembly protein SufD